MITMTCLILWMPSTGAGAEGVGAGDGLQAAASNTITDAPTVRIRRRGFIPATLAPHPTDHLRRR